MALELNGTTGVSLVQDGVVTAADLASTLDLTGKTVTLPSGTGGKVLQVVQTVVTAASFSTTPNTTWTQISPLNASITPSSTSSKILIMTDFAWGTGGPYAAWGLKIVRGSTQIYVGDNEGGNRQYATFAMDDWADSVGDSTSVTQYRTNFVYLDSPSTTSSTTYGIQVRNGRGDGSSFYLNRSFSDNSADAQTGRSASSVLLMEISA